MSRRNNILIIGSVPPPIGGVSVHIERLIDTLHQHSVDFAFYDYKKERKVTGWRKVRSSKVVHLHFSNKVLRFVATLFFFLMSKKVIATFHGKYSFSNVFDRYSLKLLTHALVLNEFSFVNAEKKEPAKAAAIQLVSAFIPPTRTDDLSGETLKEIRQLANWSEFLACTNATGYVVNDQGKDLYGIDFVLKVFAAQPSWGLVVSDPSGHLVQHYAEYTACKNIVFISSAHPFVEVIQRSDVFIRATTSDGDSISIKEALYYGIRVVASDCVDRPEGCHVYQLGSEESFIRKLREPRKANAPAMVDGAMQVMDLYHKLSITI